MNAETKVRERFVRDVAEHEMTVIRDDGMYRHLRFRMKSGGFLWFDLVTWPGYLSIVGDCESFVFRRITDMFEFFMRPGYGINGRYGINPHYWAEKLATPKSPAAETYSEDAYRQRVIEWFEDRSDGMDVDETFLFRLAVSEQLLRDPRWDDYEESSHNETGARNRLGNFEWTPPASSWRRSTIRCEDSWEWSLSEYDFHFLWCCWAIVWGIEQYQAARSAPVFDLASRCPRLALARSQRTAELATA